MGDELTGGGVVVVDFAVDEVGVAAVDELFAEVEVGEVVELAEVAVLADGDCGGFVAAVVA